MDYLGKVSDVSGCFDREKSGNHRFSAAIQDIRSRAHGAFEFDEVVKLAKTIEGELIPRLMLQHKSEMMRLYAAPSAVEVSLSTEIEQFAKLVMEHDVEVAIAQVAAIFASGVPLETIYLELLSPTANYLGKMWEQDDCNFMEVTIGLFRLNQLLRELSRTFEIQPNHAESHVSILLAPTPGEDHTFGILMVEEFFRRAGWDVTVKSDAKQNEIVTHLEQNRFDAVGFSLSSEMFEPELISMIKAIRQRSANPAILVMVGGHWFNTHPERVALVGADASAVDGRQAIVQTRTMLRVNSDRV